jgi:hypothetical protein
MMSIAVRISSKQKKSALVKGMSKDFLTCAYALANSQTYGLMQAASFFEGGRSYIDGTILSKSGEIIVLK